MSKLSIIFKIGPTSTRDKATFDSSDSAAVKKVTSKIGKEYLNAVMNAAKEPAQEEFISKLDSVQEFIRDDLEVFARQALQFFFTRKSHEEGKPLRIRFNDFSVEMTRGLGFKSAFERGFKDTEVTVKWPALSPKTIRNKKGNTTYFVHTGELLDELSRQLFPFLKVTLSPTVRVTKEEKTVETSKTSRRVANVTFSVAASKKGVNLGNVPALKSGDFRMPSNDTPGKDFDLIRKYLGEEVAWKLTNLGHGVDEQYNRPLVSPLLGYYVVNRFPKVLEAALGRHFEVKARRARSGISTQFEGF